MSSNTPALVSSLALMLQMYWLIRVIQREAYYRGWTGRAKRPRWLVDWALLPIFSALTAFIPMLIIRGTSKLGDTMASTVVLIVAWALFGGVIAGLAWLVGRVSRKAGPGPGEDRIEAC